MSSSLTAVDLFCGAGGLSEGLREAGFNVTVANEIQKDAALTFEKNHPDTKLITGDIRSISKSEIIPAIRGDVDLIAAGPPCQGFSMAGRRDINDPRNQLFKELVHVVEEVRPKFFVMENVLGLLSMDNGGVVSAIKKEFTRIGYCVKHFTLNAVDYGVPQFRERVFIIGRIDGNEPRVPERTVAKQVTTGEAISDLDFLDSGETSTMYQKQPESLYQILMRGQVEYFDLRNHEAARHTKKVRERFSLFKQGDTMNKIPEEWRTKKLIVYRMEKDRPMRTVTTLPDDFIHYSRNRILTVREYARLQSFPDHYVFYGPKSTGGLRRRVDVPQYSQVGNAVPCLLAKAVGECIKNQILSS